MPVIPDHPVRLARIRAGIGQSDLARRIGVHRSSIGALEEGRTLNPSEETLAKLDAAFGLMAGTMARRLTMWRINEEHRRIPLSNEARAVLKLSPSQISRTFPTFVAWRKRIAPSATALASLLGMNRATVARYESGIRERGMPETMQHAIIEKLGVSDDYLMALMALEPDA